MKHSINQLSNKYLFCLLITSNSLFALENVKKLINANWNRLTEQDYKDEADQACSKVHGMMETMQKITPIKHLESIHNELIEDLQKSQELCKMRQIVAIKQKKGFHPKAEKFRRKGDEAFVKGFSITNELFDIYTTINNIEKKIEQ